MGSKELNELEEKWNTISKTTEKGAGAKEAQKKVILENLGKSTLSPEGYNLREPELDAIFNNYLQTQRAKNNSKVNICIGALMVIITFLILVTMILIAVFKD